ncbi:MAG TPA: serine protease, partial [Saprospiraceae bacterium]|nr:serine protease [Saprospiraceae bacterium]
MKNKLFFNVITLVLFFLTSNVILGQKVGEKVLIQYESPHPYHTVDQPSEIVWTQEITYTERATTYLSLHFGEFELHEGDRLIVRSPDDTQRWEYTHEDNKWDGFWSIPIYGNIAIVEMKSESSNNAFGYIIDEIVRGYTQEEMDEVSLPGGCLNPNDTENIACYRENEVDVYNKSKVVARLLLDGNMGCTGWLIGDEGHLITNAHCSSENFPFELAETPNVVVEMMAEGASCGTNCNFPFACGGIIIASQVIPVKSSIANDYFLFQLQEDDRVKAEPYGYLTLRESGAIIGEQIFIPQHPHKFGKKIAFKSTHPEDTDDVCHINEYYTSSSVHPDQIATYGDTFTGSSGSPVISKNDLCVVGLHHL